MMTTSNSTFEPGALQRLADEMEIRNIVARLAHLADTASIDELDAYVSLFTADATWVVMSAPATSLPPQERHGHAEILAAAKARRADRVQGPGSNTRHVITNNVVVFTTADTAHSRSYVQVFKDTASDTPLCRSFGEYHDTFVRTPNGWRMKRREIVSP